MIYEYLTYEVAPERMQDLHGRFRNQTIRIFEKHGFKPIAFFTSEIGGCSDQLTYILCFRNLPHREECWENFKNDPEWQQIKKESEINGPLILRISNKIFRPTDYSPLK